MDHRYRRDLTAKKRLIISSTDVAVKSKSSLRSSVGFDWKANLFICSKQTIINITHQDKNDSQEVRTLHTRANAIQKCN